VVNLSLQLQSSGQCAPETGVERSNAEKERVDFLARTTRKPECHQVRKNSHRYKKAQTSSTSFGDVRRLSSVLGLFEWLCLWKRACMEKDALSTV